MELAGHLGVRSLAFPSISTGVYGYPIELAARVAVSSVQASVREYDKLEEVLFCCFSATDLALYQSILRGAR